MRRPLILIALTASLAAPASAFGSASAVIKDCAQDSKLDKTYSQADLAAARKQIPSDVDEYTDCRDVIRRAQLGGGTSNGSNPGGGTGGGATTGGAGGGDGGSSGAAPSAADAIAAATPTEREALQKAVSDGAETPVQLAGQTLNPSALGVNSLAKTHGIPTPLIVVLILLGLSSAAGLALVAKKQMNDHQRPG